MNLIDNGRQQILYLTVAMIHTVNPEISPLGANLFLILYGWRLNRG